MQRIISLWKTSTGGKLVIIAGSIIALCLSCVGISFLAPDVTLATPTTDSGAISTAAAGTALALVPVNSPSSTAEPTATSAPTFTDIPITDYPQVAAARFQTLEQAINELTVLHQQLIADITLAANTEWYATMNATLFRVEAGVSELAAMNNVPPEYAAFHQTLLQLENETKLASPEYTQALDHQDVEALNRATQYLGNMITYTNQAHDAITAASATATPLATETSIPLPTAAPVQPTAAQSNCHPSYVGACVPYPPPDLNCGDIPGNNIQVVGPDVHDLDGNKDGIACEG